MMMSEPVGCVHDPEQFRFLASPPSASAWLDVLVKTSPDIVMFVPELLMAPSRFAKDDRVTVIVF